VGSITGCPCQQFFNPGLQKKINKAFSVRVIVICSDHKLLWRDSYKGIGHASTLPEPILHKIIIILKWHRIENKRYIFNWTRFPKPNGHLKKVFWKLKYLKLVLSSELQCLTEVLQISFSSINCHPITFTYIFASKETKFSWNPYILWWKHVTADPKNIKLGNECRKPRWDLDTFYYFSHNLSNQIWFLSTTDHLSPASFFNK